MYQHWQKAEVHDMKYHLLKMWWRTVPGDQRTPPPLRLSSSALVSSYQPSRRILPVPCFMNISLPWSRGRERADIRKWHVLLISSRSQGMSVVELFTSDKLNEVMVAVGWDYQDDGLREQRRGRVVVQGEEEENSG